jgi:hypothetical protein
MILAIDTSAGTSVAVVAEDGTVVVERSTADTRRHAEVIGPFLNDALSLLPGGRRALTAIVVGISLTAVGLALSIRLYNEYGTLRADALREVIGDE